MQCLPSPQPYASPSDQWAPSHLYGGEFPVPSLLFFLLPFPGQIFIFLINVASSFGAPQNATRPIIFKIKDPSHSFDCADFCFLFHLPSLGYSTTVLWKFFYFISTICLPQLELRPAHCPNYSWPKSRLSCHQIANPVCKSAVCGPFSAGRPSSPSFSSLILSYTLQVASLGVKQLCFYPQVLFFLNLSNSG